MKLDHKYGCRSPITKTQWLETDRQRRAEARAVAPPKPPKPCPYDDPDCTGVHSKGAKSEMCPSSYKIRMASNRRWMDANAEQVRQASRDWYYERGGRDKSREMSQRWRDANIEHRRATSRMTMHRRRARLAGIFQEDMTVQEIWERDNGKCYMCGSEVALADVHVEHMIPVASSSRVFRRLRSSCASCNLSKKAKLLVPFLIQRQRLGRPISAEYQRCMDVCPLFGLLAQK